MSKYPRHVWNQLKNKTTQDIASALERDGWIREGTGGATVGFRHADRPPEHNRVVLHPHPKKTMGPALLKGLLDTIGWSEDDLVRLRLVKTQGRRRK